MKGLLLNITGDGKGKTTAALGTVIRALGRGWRVAVFQFVKNGMETGEKLFFEQHPCENLVFEQTGDGFSWTKGDHAGHARAGWEKVRPYLRGERECGLLVLDELNVALSLGWLDAEIVAEELEKRTPELNVLVTGRNAPERILAVSDLVSRIENVRHPFDSGQPAVPGIDF